MWKTIEDMHSAICCLRCFLLSLSGRGEGTGQWSGRLSTVTGGGRLEVAASSMAAAASAGGIVLSRRVGVQLA